MSTPPSAKDELYAYDDLNRLTDARRGDLNQDKTALTSTGFRQNWTLDALGNWGGFKQDTSGDGTTWGLQQSRTHNKVNEIDTDDSHANGPDEAAVTEGQGQAAWVGAKYDAAGNTLQGPKPGAETTRHKYVYDAWNRLVKVTDNADVTIAEYRYDAVNRRIARLVKDAGSWDRTDYYHNAAWQVVEERAADDVSDPNKDTPATTVKGHWVWDARYVDAPVLRYRYSGETTETLYYCQDANYNVTALVDASTGAVVERYLYDPYGKVTVCDGSWTVIAWADSKKNEILFCGYRWDPETGLYHVRNRMYHPTLGRWMQRDPQGYVDGMGLYEYVGCNPCVRYDSLGLYSWDEFTGDIKTVVSVGKEAVHTYAIFIVHGENPISAGVCTVEAGIVVGGAFTRGEAAYEAAKEAGVGDPEASRIGDAVRHATWQGETTKAFGEDIAKEMGDYHERGDETVDSRQDRENNKTARQIGKDAKNLDDIHERVKDSLGKGDLVTDFKDPRIAPAPVSEKESDSKPAEADKYNREKDLRNVKATAKRLDHNDRVSRRPPGLQR